MPQQLIDKVALIHICNRKILTTRSKNKSKFYFPGGKREGGESDLCCLTREVKEELDVQLLEDTVRFFDIFEATADGHHTEIKVQMRCYFASFSGIIKASNEIACYTWIRHEDKEKTSAVDQLILDRLKSLDLID